jgi:drug/metabolite transporter (DMT)-like permease
MVRILLILLIGLVFESTGVVLLKKGMIEIGEVKVAGVADFMRAARAGVTNTHILLGVFFEALFFACLLVLMAKSDISFLWPLTALSFVFATFASIWFLHEHVSPVRWAGVILIMIGAGLISYSEQAKPEHREDPAPLAPGSGTGSRQDTVL